MARIRTIKPAFFTSEDICKRQPLARLLFAGLWTEADRDGYLADSPFQLRTRLLPADACDVDALLWELADDRVAAPLIRRYRAENGRHYIQILAFIEHQRPHPKEPKGTIPQTGAARKHGPAVERNGEQVMLPGDIPSSPVGREGDLESGVQEGDLGREGTVPVSRPLISGEASPMGYAKVHGNHVAGFCDWLCLPDFLFNEFVRKCGQVEDGSGFVRRWALSVRQTWEGQPIGDDALVFWRARWTEFLGTTKAAGAAESSKPVMTRYNTLGAHE